MFAAAQVLAAAFRIGGGRWSDVLGARIVPLRRVGVAIVAVMLLTGAARGRARVAPRPRR